MFQYFEESITKKPESLKAFITRNFDQIEKDRKNKKTPKKKKKNDEEKDEDKDEAKKQTKTTSIRNLVRFTSMLLQYVAAFIQKSQLDFTDFSTSSTLGQHLLHYLQHTSTATKMMSKIDEREDEKGHMILVR